MEKFDGRKIGREEMEQIRIRAVKLVLQGESPEKVIAALGFSRACIYNWLARYRAGGWEALRSGKHTGRPKKLDDNQFALWTRSMVIRLIHKQFGIQLSVSSVGRLLLQMGMHIYYPKALYWDWHDELEIVKDWEKTEFLKIKKRGKKLGATIYFKHEYDITVNIPAGMILSPEGQPKERKVTSPHLIGAVTTRGHMRFMVNQGDVTKDVLCDFLKRLMHNTQQHIFLIWDERPTHKSRKVREHIKSFKGKLEVYFTPPIL
jgi:transposase